MELEDEMPWMQLDPYKFYFEWNQKKKKDKRREMWSLAATFGINWRGFVVQFDQWVKMPSQYRYV